MNLAFYTYFYGDDNNNRYGFPIIPSIKYKCYYYTNNIKLFKELDRNFS